MKDDQYARQAEDWTERAYADAATYLAHRADLVIGLGAGAQAGGGGTRSRLRRWRPRELLVASRPSVSGVDSTAEMVEAARHRLGDRAVVDADDLNDYVPPLRCCDHGLPRHLLRARAARVLPSRRSVHGEEARLRPEPAPVPARRRSRRPRAAGFTHIALRPFFMPQTRALPRQAAAVARVLERTGPLARLVLRFRFTYLVAASRQARTAGSRR